MRTNESLHVGSFGFEKTQARQPNTPTYDEHREYVSVDNSSDTVEVEQARLEQARMPLGQLVSVQLPAARPEVA